MRAQFLKAGLLIVAGLAGLIGADTSDHGSEADPGKSGSSQDKPLFVQVATPSPTPSPAGQIPAPCASPSGILCFDRVPPTMIVLTLAQDPATGVAISLEIANRFNRPGGILAKSPVIFQPAPFGWGLADFVNACTAAPISDSSLYHDVFGKPLRRGIVGALIVFAASTQVTQSNYGLFVLGNTRIDAQAQFARCTTVNAAGGAVLAEPVGPVFDDLIGSGAGTSLSLGPGAAIGSALNALSQARQEQTAAMYVYPTVSPSGPPIPHASAYKTSYTTSGNANPDTSVLLANSVISQLNSSSNFIFPGINAPAQLKIAAQHIADDLISRVNSCPAVTMTTDLQDLFGVLLPSAGRTPDPTKKPSIC